MISSFRAKTADNAACANLHTRELSIEWVPIKKLELNPNNPRVHSEKQVRQLAGSIKAFGFNAPILVDADLKIIAGHGRVQAAELLGMKYVPTIRLEH